jgi:O-acetyl-ADP-ribose deacetylase
MEYKAGKTTIKLITGDITRCRSDAIVNAANSALQLGGGVAGAILRAGGESIQRECDSIGGTPVGTAAITGGGKLAARYVIHAVGPREGEGNEARKLAGATRASLEIADIHGLKSVALPAVSSGIFGVPLRLCARTMLSTTVEYLHSGEHSLQIIVFCLFDIEALHEFEQALSAISNSTQG